nr:protein translocase subunit SecDF [Bacteroidota bacterium]
MQNKGLIRALAIILTIVCLFQLSYTWMVKSVESSAKSYGKGNVALENRYLDSMKTQKVFPPLLNVFTYKECKDRELNLGLDLKGGMNVTLELSTADVIRGLSNNSTDKDFTSALNNAVTRQGNSQEGLVKLFGEEFTKINPNNKLAAIFSTADLQSKVTYKSTNEEVLSVIQAEVNDAIKRSYNIIRTRIDKFGVTQPNVQQLANDRILVELPGVKEKERVRKLLQGTAELEFWPTYNFGEVVGQLVEVNKTLKLINERDSLAKATASGITPSVNDTTKKSADTLANSTDSLLNQIKNTASNDTTGKDSTGAGKQMSAEQFKREYPLFSLMTPADYMVKTQEDQKFVYESPRLGFAMVSDTAEINALLNRPDIRSIIKNDLQFAWTAKSSNPENDNVRELIALKVSGRDGRAPLDGSHVSEARGDRSQTNNQPEVLMQMNPEGAAIWKRMTGENKGRCIAIVLDNFVYSYPKVNEVIPNGSSNISGNFTDADAADLANILKAGKLPAPCRIIEESVVGPTLGEKAINDGLMSFVIAIILVMLFMVLYYNNAGWVADAALVVNLIMLFGVLTAFNAVLTLPGIAGIVLTLGMAVDANVLIYERIREELRAGKGVRLAINDGYQMAYSAIIDSNVTTILTGIILYIFGTGPIQGFATTLIIGIITSMFTSIFISRLIFEWMLNTNKSIKFSTKTTENLFRNKNIDFIGMRNKAYIASGAVILIGLISIAVTGFNQGVDFKGGRSYRVQFNEAKNAEDVRVSLATQFGNGTEVKTLENDRTFKITTPFMIESNDADADNIVEKKLTDGLKINKDQIIWSQKVGPTVADDIKQEAVLALIFGLLAIFLYIVARFRKWTFGAGAIIALAHDTLIILGVFSIFKNIMPFSMDLDQAFIAAILTVMGYSINDTVVVFDRIREYLGIHKKGEMSLVINKALNDTLSRTINTSLTIFFVLLAIFIFGGETIRAFSFALLLGIIVGTYSSIFIATPIVIDFDKKEREIKK